MAERAALRGLKRGHSQTRCAIVSLHRKSVLFTVGQIGPWLARSAEAPARPSSVTLGPVCGGEFLTRKCFMPGSTKTSLTYFRHGNTSAYNVHEHNTKKETRRKSSTNMQNLEIEPTTSRSATIDRRAFNPLRHKRICRELHRRALYI